VDEKNSKKEVASFIKEELKKIKKLIEELSGCRGDSYILRRAKGSILQDFYNACERIFETVARDIDGGEFTGQRWHKKLLKPNDIRN